LKPTTAKTVLPSLAAMMGATIAPGRIVVPMDELKCVSRQTLNRPRREDAESRLARIERKARRKKRMRLRLHRGRGCAG
jgi:hypothetical protein